MNIAGSLADHDTYVVLEGNAKVVSLERQKRVCQGGV